VTLRPLAAVDLGAASGRVMVGWIEPERVQLTEVHRFANDPVRLPDGLHWDILRLYQEVVVGLRLAGQAVAGESAAGLLSVGIDSWAVDFGLLDGAGRLAGNPYHYRDSRTEAGVRAVHAVISKEDLYARTGLQFLPFNTLYQLAASRRSGELDSAQILLLIPDLLGYWLTGQQVAEMTNASTTGLFDIHQRTWADDLIAELQFDRQLLPELQPPGRTLGTLLPEVARETDLAIDTVVTLVGSHDTASAVVGVPALHNRFAYISCGTWALVGLELDAAVVSEQARLAQFTNEVGVDGRIRFLHNVMGLWLLQESLRTWERMGLAPDIDVLHAAAAELPAGGPLIDPNDGALLPPGDMPSRIEDACRRTGQPIPVGPAAFVRCILDSLALAFARSIAEAERLADRRVEVIHLVGGGARNRLLCQLTANACELPVLAGPVEAAALGNVLVQARAHGLLSGTLEDLRALIAATHEITRYVPRGRPAGGD
jgi:rhamnulokinase